MKNKILKNMEWSVVVCVILLTIIGCIELYSVTESSGYTELKKQLLWFSISIPITIAIITIDYNIIAKISPILYIIMFLLLIGVLFTDPINGATSWYNIGSISFQPSEFAKICVILSLSLAIVKVQKNEKEQISRPIQLLKCLLVVIIPVLLIVKQPDYGTAIAFCVATAIILITSGINKKYIITAIVLTIIALPLLYFFVLPSHAKTRIDVFLNPNLDPRGSGYNVLQSKLAIGSGKMLGMGIKNGSQTQLGYLYPQTTDFIYSAVGEEMGFIVAACIIILYIVLITKALHIAKTAKDDLGSYIASGIAGIFLFHMVENIGMTMGLLPITGVPLPFVSYGGSSLLTNCILIGLLLNISGRRNKTMFAE
ncbi:MAG: rod shape-determining protein RodA [Clostridia bacterium]|nr:rod shape-determining protein RodA [Clostridia bacterium]